MFTRVITPVLVHVVAFAAVMSVPSPARAQDNTILVASGSAGGSVIPAFAVKLADPATATAVDLQGRKFINAATWGGSIGVWKKADGRRLIWGLRGEVSRQKTDANSQTLSASGTLFGQPYTGPLPAPPADGSAIVATGTFLIGGQLGGGTTSAFGRVTPYAGFGGGIDRVTGTFSGSGEATDIGAVFQVVGGVAIGLGHRVSTFAEYRYHRVSQHLVLGTQNIDFAVRPNHVVAGVTVKLR